MDYRGRNIEQTKNLLEALKQMDALDKKLLIVVKGSKFIGLLSAGDIQRAIINNKSLELTRTN
jgi:predicted transcriptional regulator